MYAIVKNGGKQYKVQEGDILHLDKLGIEIGSEIELDVLAVVQDGKLSLNSGSVKAEILEKVKIKK